MQEQILHLLLEQEEVGWKTILYDLVKSEQMDPWDINITLLTQKYIEVIKNMKENNLRISGKVLLAAAFLLKMKSTHLVENDITKLDQLINQSEEEIEETILDELGENKTKKILDKYKLIPKNPQPRNRKVSIHDLVQALQHAMVSKKRILAQIRPVQFKMPQKKVDIMEILHDVYHKLIYYTSKEQKDTVTFTQLLPPRAGKQEKVYTFIPLLHLENHHKVEMAQSKPFEEIHVTLLAKEKSI
jgi:segregation and condensation protein A